MPTRLLAAVVVLLLPTSVEAQAEGAGDASTLAESSSEPVLFGATAELEAPIASTHRLDPTAAGTEVAVPDRVTADTRVADLLFEVPGTVVAQTGAQGSFATVGLRGAEFGQTRYMLEDLPLTGPDTGAFDLSLLPVNAFDRLEVYRGGAPAWLGTGAIGGVVRLVPRSHQSDRVRTSLTTGSFGTWRTDAETAVATSAVRAVGSVGLATTRGDYAYLYDLPDKRSDEDIRQRRNAENLGAHGLLYVSSDLGDRGRLSAVVLGVSRHGGAPGPAARQALRTHRSDTWLLSTVGYSLELDGARFQLVLGGGYQRRRFFDPYGEIGLREEATDDRIANAFVRAASEVELTSWADLTLVGTGRYDGYHPANALDRDAGDSYRWTGAGTAELRLHGAIGSVRFELRPSVRLEHSETRALGLRLGQPQRHRTSRTAPTVRVGAAVAPTWWLSFVASAATGTRFPSILELFGNRGTPPT